MRQIGVTTEKSSPNLTMVVHLVSPDNSRDALYLRNYGQLNVRDELLRIPGMGSVILFGAGDYAMRIWLDPAKLAARSITTGEVVAAIREQNAQVAAGTVGASPSPKGTEFQLAVNTQGRLTSEEQFADIIVRSEPATGGLIRVRDLGRVELSAGSYSLRSLLNNKEAAAIAIFQAPGSNALALSNHVRATMERLKADFPQGMSYSIVYDPTRFVQTSIAKVIETLFIAVALVVLVVILFLQTWRASIIPLIAVPVSIVGTFTFLLLLGYSINTLTLFGLVLAIGIVVDDAIVVVENAERNIERGLSAHDATVKAMQEVSRPIIAIALVLCAVFVPLAFVPGLTGQFYKQFAVTIAISTVISAFNSLTLSPALSALLLRPHDAPRDWLTRGMDTLFGGFFRWFNGWFGRRSEAYGRGVTRIVQRKSVTMLVYAVLLALTAFLFTRIPSGFVPAPDKQYLIGIAQLPAGASLDRTDAVIRQMSDIALKVPGIVDSVAFPGLSIAGFSAAPNEGIVFFGLKPFEERTSPELSKFAILGKVNGAIQQIQGARMFVVPPPAVDGLGNAGGFKLQVQDRDGLGEQALYGAVWGTLGQVYMNPKSSIGTPYSTYDINVPQLYANVDRVRAKQMGVALGDIYDTMQVNLGSLYVNDFSKFGKTYQVVVQADAPYRADAEAITALKTRNSAGEMVPLGALMKVEPTFGPTRVTRYNGYPSADINGAAKPGFSSGPGRGRDRVAAQAHPDARPLLRVDRAHVPGPAHAGRHLAGNPHQRAGARGRDDDRGAARDPGAVGAVRELQPADGDRAHRADVRAGGAVRRLAVALSAVRAAGRPQHLHPGGARRARRAGVQERDPDRRVRQGARGTRPGPARRRDPRLPHAAAADPDDVDRVLRRRAAAHLRQRRGQRDAPGDGHRGVLRDARRDGVRHLPDAGVLRPAAWPAREATGGNMASRAGRVQRDHRARRQRCSAARAGGSRRQCVEAFIGIDRGRSAPSPWPPAPSARTTVHRP